MWTIFKLFIEFVTILLLFFVLVFWPRGMWGLSSPTRVRTRTPCIGRRSLNHWTTREVPIFLPKAEMSTDSQDLNCKVQKHSSNYLKKEWISSHNTPWKSWDLIPGMIGYRTQKPNKTVSMCVCVSLQVSSLLLSVSQLWSSRPALLMSFQALMMARFRFTSW